MEKTHRVRLAGPWMYEKHYPGADPFVIHVPAETAIEMDDASYQSLKRMNDAPGRPTLAITRLADDAAVEVSVPEMIKRVNADLEARGIHVRGAERAMVTGKYKGLFATAEEATAAATAAAAASKAPDDDAADVAPKTRGGK